MLRGMATSRYHAVDLQAATQWYSEVLGIEPYFVTPWYVEFRVGDYQHELGIDGQMPATPAGVITYWSVDNVEGAYTRLLALGATEHEKPRKFGEGFIAGSVIDPFGNILGVMFNQHYLDVLSRIPAFELPEVIPNTEATG